MTVRQQLVVLRSPMCSAYLCMFMDSITNWTVLITIWNKSQRIDQTKWFFCSFIFPEMNLDRNSTLFELLTFVLWSYGYHLNIIHSYFTSSASFMIPVAFVCSNNIPCCVSGAEKMFLLSNFTLQIHIINVIETADQKKIHFDSFKLYCVILCFDDEPHEQNVHDSMYAPIFRLNSPHEMFKYEIEHWSCDEKMILKNKEISRNKIDFNRNRWWSVIIDHYGPCTHHDTKRLNISSFPSFHSRINAH